MSKAHKTISGVATKNQKLSKKNCYNYGDLVEMANNNKNSKLADLVSDLKKVSKKGTKKDSVICLEQNLQNSLKRSIESARSNSVDIDYYYCRRPNPNKEAGGCPLKQFTSPCSDDCPDGVQVRTRQ